MKIIYDKDKELLYDKSIHILKYICSYCGQEKRGKAMNIYEINENDGTLIDMDIICKECQSQHLQYHGKIPYII